MKRICVNCGSSPGFNPCYMEMAKRLGQTLADHHYELVYGGTNVGLMGRVADTVLEAGGVVRGVIPESFAHDISHQGLTELYVVGSMHERKTMMFDLSDAFVGLPGGFGTLEELTELLTWAQLGLHSKPCGLINVDGYFNLLLSFIENAVSNGFIKQEHREMLLVSEDPEDLLNQAATYKMQKTEKWAV
ncbi:MAG: TIGR00730 family Rossman fold protein [Thermodesulfobacteriota bacterium]|nr:TIGR00730 family Rossman fold protein [Thermodesulfobacteriota bacterium]